MNLKSIPLDQFIVPAADIWASRWFALSSGDFASGRFNTMTVAWGSFGTMWQWPFAQVVVRPTRYTYEFMEKYPTFTLCAFDLDHQAALEFLGSRSGRDGDKVAESGLTPVASSRVAAPSFAEAELIIECVKIYWDDVDPSHFLDPEIENRYPLRDYHRSYFGRIEAVLGLSA
jgi:flavin reductase (DIM6/NTAB) family NADH-FMN oxidoreductase RutF